MKGTGLGDVGPTGCRRGRGGKLRPAAGVTARRAPTTIKCRLFFSPVCLFGWLLLLVVVFCLFACFGVGVGEGGE